jgi:hypothetical protein
MRFGSGVMLTVNHRAETTDDLGDTTAVVTTEQWGPCAVAPRYARESVDPNVAPVVVGKEIYGPAITLAASDEILIDGEVWQVDGRAADFTGAGANPFTGWAPGVVVPIKRVSNA